MYRRSTVLHWTYIVQLCRGTVVVKGYNWYRNITKVQEYYRDQKLYRSSGVVQDYMGP